MSAASHHPILTAWDRVLSARGNDPAILGPGGETFRRFADFEEDARSIAGASGGCLPDGVVAVQVGNSVLLPGILLLLWRIGSIPVLLDRSLEGAALESALETCGASALITTPATASVTNDSSFSIALRIPPAAQIDAQFLKLTSGTTSAARAIRFTAAQLLADCNSVCDTMGITERDLNYGVIPWSHSYGFSNLVTPLLCRGVPVVAAEDRLPRAILQGLSTSGATVFPAVPVLFQKLAELRGARPERLRLCISAGAPLAESTAAAFRRQYGLKIHGFYGSSECGGIAYDASEDEVPEGCVGEAMRGVNLQHDESTGRIEVRSAAVGTGYYPEPDASVLDAGRFVPGDLLRRTPQGYVIAGRVSDFINIAGRKLNPVEIEQALRALPGVRDAVVFGVPHPARGEEPIACVAGNVALEALQSHCAASLAPWKMPRDFWQVESLPVNERGKCSRRALAELYLQTRRG